MFGRKKDKKDKNEKDDYQDPLMDLDEVLNQFLKMQEEMLKGFMGNGEVRTYTRRVTVGPDGQPKVEEFVNGLPVSNQGQSEIKTEPEVVESGDKVIVTVEVPEARKEELKVTLKNKTKLVIENKGDKTEVSLPGPSEPYL